MIDVTQHGIVEGSDPSFGVPNRTALVALYKSLSPQRGGLLYWPAGIYRLAPIYAGVEGLARADTTYCSMLGDGFKSTILLSSEDGRSLFDWDDLNCFDQSFEKISFIGQHDDMPYAMKFTSGAYHYRIGIRDCQFRCPSGIGLEIVGSVYTLSHVSFTNNDIGLVIGNTNNVFADNLDVEFNASGGVLITGRPDGFSMGTHIAHLASESSQPALVIGEDVSGVRVSSMTFGSEVQFKTGSHYNLVQGNSLSPHFETGSWSNRVEGWMINGTGDFDRNYHGPPSGVFADEKNHPPDLNSRILHHPYPHSTWQEGHSYKVDPDTDYLYSFDAQCLGGGWANLYLSIQTETKDGVGYWWNGIEWIDHAATMDTSADRRLTRLAFRVRSHTDREVIYVTLGLSGANQESELTYVANRSLDKKKQ